MAVTAENVSRVLKLKVEVGVTESGQPKYATRSFGNIDTAATIANMRSVGAKLAALTSTPLGEIQDQQLDNLKENA